MTVTPQTFRRLAVLACVLLVGTGAATASTAAAASSATPCWKRLITDWYDGRIDHSYPISCYKSALKHLPQDVRAYSDAYDVISRALASATKGKKHVNGNAVIPPPPSNGGGGGGSSSGGGGGGSGGTGTGHPGDQGGTGQVQNSGSGFLNDAVGKMGSNNADSVPVPLLVLAGLALLLVAAGAIGLVARRMQGRNSRP